MRVSVAGQSGEGIDSDVDVEDEDSPAEKTGSVPRAIQRRP